MAWSWMIGIDMFQTSRRRVFALTAILFALAGCQTEGSLIGVTGFFGRGQAEESFTIVQPSGAEVADTLAPADLTAVLRATVMRLRGGTDEDAAARYGVRNTGGKTVSGAALKGLSLDRVSLVVDRPLADSPPGRQVEGVLLFSDDVGRSLSIGLTVDYRTLPGAVEIERLVVAPIFLPHPVVEMFVVPGDKMKRVSERTVKDYPAFYKKVRQLAVDMRDPSAGGGGVQEYAFVVFVKDIAPAGSSIEFKFASEPNSRNGDVDDNVFHYVYDGGWALGAISRDLDLRAGPERWVKVVFRPNPDATGPKDRVRMIGLFSTRPGGGPQALKLEQRRTKG